MQMSTTFCTLSKKVFFIEFTFPTCYLNSNFCMKEIISMEKNIIIPVAIQIVADDFGWHNGRDERSENRPSRSGLPRDHAPEDYLVLNELGRAIDMKILTPFVIGEWDKDNLLRGVKYATWDEQGWDRASEIDMRMAEKYFEAAESSEYIEYAYHALLHGYYKDGLQICETEYSRPAYDAATNTHDHTIFDYIPEAEMQTYIDLFFDIYRSWGFKKEIRSFVSPCSIHTPPEKTYDFARILRKNNFIHWANVWNLLKDTTAVFEGVTFLQKNGVIDWDQYDADPLMLHDHCSGALYSPSGRICPACGYHWTNFLRFNPLNNMERLPDWVKYFKRQGSIYGQMLSRDIAFASSQAVYSRFGQVRIADGRCTIDLSLVDAQKALSTRDTFFISTRLPVKPQTCIGGTMTLYEKHKHQTWQIVRSHMQNEISFEIG